MSMLLNIQDYRLKARKVLPRFVFEYVDNGAENEECLRANRQDFEKIRLTPRVLRDTSHLDTTVTVFGQTWRWPFAIAPTGLNGLIRPGGDGMLACAAAAMGVPFVLSTASNQRLEAIRSLAPHGQQWLQLYVMEDRSLARQLVLRARRVGYAALVLTVDVPVSGNRWRDARNGFRLPFHITPRLALDTVRHPKWALRMMAKGTPQLVNLEAGTDGALSAQARAQAQATLLSRTMDRSLTWESLRWLRELWDGPLLIKGVLHPDDARLAANHGVDGIIVSNHGGRQSDASPSAISVVGPIADGVPRLPVFLDSGVRCGADILRAQSCGARAVFLGRPVLYGLACNGEKGVKEVLQLLADDYTTNLTLQGACIGSRDGTTTGTHGATAYSCS